MRQLNLASPGELREILNEPASILASSQSRQFLLTISAQRSYPTGLG